MVDPIAFGEKFIALLDAGRYTATYKFAVLLALIDACSEGLDASGAPPVQLSAKDVGARVLEIYWPQAAPFRATTDDLLHLRQSTQPNDLIKVIAAFRAQHGLTGREVAEVDGSRLAPLRRQVATTVIRMPLPRLQKIAIGSAVIEDRFLYDYSWTEDTTENAIWRDDFDDALRLRPGIGTVLVRLSGLLRPLVQERWASKVAGWSREIVDAASVSDFLFGEERIALSAVRSPLVEIQSGRCFYCQRALASTADVDHFIPWARHPDNGLENLVAAHPACNNAKRHSLAAASHLARWHRRFDPRTEEHAAQGQLRDAVRWRSDPRRTLAAARSAYLWLPERTFLWRLPNEYEHSDSSEIRRILLA